MKKVYIVVKMHRDFEDHIDSLKAFLNKPAAEAFINTANMTLDKHRYYLVIEEVELEAP